MLRKKIKIKKNLEKFQWVLYAIQFQRQLIMCEADPGDCKLAEVFILFYGYPEVIYSIARKSHFVFWKIFAFKEATLLVRTNTILLLSYTLWSDIFCACVNVRQLYF